MTDDELQQLRARVYKLADQVASHDLQINEHGVLIKVLNTYVEGLRSTMATREQLDAAIAVVTLGQSHIHDDLGPIKKGIHWAVGLILTAFLLGLIGLVWKGGGP